MVAHMRSRRQYALASTLDAYYSSLEQSLESPQETTPKTIEDWRMAMSVMASAAADKVHLLFDTWQRKGQYAAKAVRAFRKAPNPKRWCMHSALVALSSPENSGTHLILSLSTLARINHSLLRRKAIQRTQQHKNKAGPPPAIHKPFDIPWDKEMDLPHAAFMQISATPFTISKSVRRIRHRNWIKLTRTICAVPDCHAPVASYKPQKGITYHSPFCHEHTKALYSAEGRTHIFSSCYFCGWTGITELTLLPWQNQTLINVCPNCYYALQGLGSWNAVQQRRP
jgi:hypothetical protein